MKENIALFFKRFAFAIVLCLCAHINSFAKLPWHNVANGIEYQLLSSPNLYPFAQIHAFKIDLKKTEFSFCAQHNAQKLSELAKAKQALLVFNSGFFDKNKQPLGLRINNGKIFSRLKRISWWGVFSIKKHRARIDSYRDFRRSKYTQFAIQAGPRLVYRNKLVSLRPGSAERTALGITKDGDVILVVTEHSPITTRQLAIMMRDKLHCQDALNLDGGGSTQLYANMNDFSREVSGRVIAPDPICIKSREG